MSFILSVVGLLIVVWALYFLVTRRRRRRIAPGNAGTPQPGHAADASATGPWPRSDRIALASLVVGAVLGVLGLVAR